MCIIELKSYKATKADRLRGKTWKIIKRVSRNSVGELRYEGRGRWGCILSLRC